MKINTVFKHLISPFSDKQAKAKLNKYQIGISCAAGTALLPFFLVPGFAVFFGLTGYFKYKKIQKLNAPSAYTTTQKTHQQSKSLSQAKQSSNVSASSEKPKQKLSQDKHSTKAKSSSSSSESSTPSAESLPFGFEDLRNATQTADIRDCLNKIFDFNKNDPKFLKNLKKGQPDCFNDLLKAGFHLEDQKLVFELIKWVKPSKLEDLLEENDLLDLELQFPDPVKTNKFLLQSTMPYFKTMFTSNFKESAQDFLEINDDYISAVTFNDCLQFALYDSIDISEDNLESILYTANFYEIEGLKQTCEEWILEHCDEYDDGIAGFHELANLYRLDGIVNECIKPLLVKYFDDQLTNEEEELLFASMPVCTKLDLSQVDTSSNKLLTLLESAQNLISLNVSNFNPTNFNIEAVLHALPSLTKLEHLYLNNCPSADWSLSTYLLLKIAPLKTLELQNNPLIPGEALKIIGKLPELRRLDLSLPNTGKSLLVPTQLPKASPKNQRFSESQLAHLSNLSKLQFLDLGGRNIRSLSFLTNLVEIKTLRVENGHFQGDELANLQALPYLKHLILRGCAGIRDQDLHYLENLPNLISLDLLNCTQVSTLPSPFNLSKQLENLDIRCNILLADIPSNLFKDLTKLKTLKTRDATFTFNSKNQSINTLFHFDTFYLNKLPSTVIQKIEEITYQKKITDRYLEELKQFYNIKKLTLLLSPYLTSKGIKHLNHFKDLESLSLVFDDKSSITSLSFSKLKRLKKLKIHLPPKILKRMKDKNISPHKALSLPKSVKITLI